MNLGLENVPLKKITTLVNQWKGLPWLNKKSNPDVGYSSYPQTNIKINKIPSEYENIILSILNFNPKFVLGGSISLYIIDVMNYNFYERFPDVDLALKAPLTVQELSAFRDFFNLQQWKGSGMYEGLSQEQRDAPYTMENELSKEIIQFRYDVRNPSEEEKAQVIKIDIFNTEYLKPRDILTIPYQEQNININQPCVTLSYKCRYALDIRVGKQQKHWDDMKVFFDGKQTKRIDSTAVKYFDIMNNIQYAQEQNIGLGTGLTSILDI